MDVIVLESEEPSDEEVSWRGCSMNEIYRNLNEWELRHYPAVHPTDSHTVLYHFPIRNRTEPGRPLRDHDKWDSLHVRLPCSAKSLYPVAQADGTDSIKSRWELIQRAFIKPIKNSRELEAAIVSYNSKYDKVWKFSSLHKLFEEDIDEQEERSFFENLLPKIVALALKLPEIVMAPIPLLKQGQNRSITLSQLQISSLLANAFLCTFPRRNTMKRKSEYSTFPDINFSRLFQSTGPQVIEKIRCICHYFRRVCNSTPLGVVTFTRRSIAEKDLPNWEECNAPLGATPLHVSSAGTIEDQGKGLLQVDFANKFLGGGVLGSGCVQEEIRFVICPELLVSKLFTEALKPYEALIMIGCEQFSKYSGYASTFTWDGDFEDSTPLDESSRRQCNIIAIDALHFVQSSHQYREELIMRELNKAYVGFIHTLDTPAPAVASGNWGCGAFGGDAALKALIQLMACTITKRPLVYYTFGNTELRNSIHDIHTFFIENNVTVKQLWSYLKEFRSHKLSPTNLYHFICQIHCDKQNAAKTKANSSWIRPLIKQLAIAKTITNPQKPNSSPVTKPNKKVIESKMVELCEPLQEPNTSRDLFLSESSPETSSRWKRKDEIETVDFTSPPANNVVSIAPKAADKKLRQKSLLEMLDCFYNTSAKRHCGSKKCDD